MRAVARASLSFALGAAIGTVLTQVLLTQAPLLPTLPPEPPSASAAGTPPAARASAALSPPRVGGGPAGDRAEILPYEEWLRESERNLVAPLQRAVELAQPERTLALRRLGDHWGGIDARRALAAGENIEDRALRRLFRGYVLEAWAAVDPGAVLAHLPTYLAEESTGQTGTGLDIVAFVSLPNASAARASMPIGVWTSLAAADAYGLLAAAGRLPIGERELAQQFAIVELARRDVREALALVERLPPAPRGRDREGLMYAVAHVYARSNLDAALAWARDLSPQSEGALTAVMVEAATVDGDRALNRALELVLQERSAASSRTDDVAALAIRMALATSPQRSAYIANQLAAAPQSQARALLHVVLSEWSRQRPGDALDWLVANRARMDAATAFEAFFAFDDAIVSRDPDSALRVVSELPRDRRAAWIAPRIKAAARIDRRRAEDFVDRLAGSAEHDAAVTAFIEALAPGNPREAARRVELASPNVQARASAAVAAAWARDDPAAAAEWTQRIAHPLERASAVYAVARAWAQVDVDSTQAWLLTMPEGTAREAGLDVVRSIAEARANASRANAERTNAEPLLPAFDRTGR